MRSVSDFYAGVFRVTPQTCSSCDRARVDIWEFDISGNQALSWNS